MQLSFSLKYNAKLRKLNGSQKVCYNAMRYGCFFKRLRGKIRSFVFGHKRGVITAFLSGHH